MSNSDAPGAEVKTTQDVLKMTGKDELKFGVLIGLIKVGQVSNRDVVDTVLNLVSVSFLFVTDWLNFLELCQIEGTIFDNSPRPCMVSLCNFSVLSS